MVKPDCYRAKDLGFPLKGYVYCYPGQANYLGGDILSGIVETEIYKQEEISVFLDIGTNGELVIGNKDFLVAGAGAAGPALEGGVVKTGMRAEPGAVDRVHIENGQVEIHVIGETAAEGICGSGIVDLSHKFPKMYAIRPQFFIPLITILRNSAMKTIEARHELEVVKSQNLDVIRFEEDVRNFKDAFGRNYRLACDRFSDAVNFIDKTIADLQKAKENLLKSENNLRLADNKLEDFTIRKLTKNNPTMRQAFDEAGIDV